MKITTERITTEQMAAHVESGRAAPWNHRLGPTGALYAIARFDDTWWVMLDGEDTYQPAPDELATRLTQGAEGLAAADRAIADQQAWDEASNAASNGARTGAAAYPDEPTRTS